MLVKSQLDTSHSLPHSSLYGNTFYKHTINYAKKESKYKQILIIKIMAFINHRNQSHSIKKLHENIMLNYYYKFSD